MQRTISAAKERASAPNPADTESTKESTHAGQIWKDRSFKLAKLVYDLEVQKLDLKKRLGIAEALTSAPGATDVPAAVDGEPLAQLLELQEKLNQQEQSLIEREKMLKVAAGKARADILAMKSKSSEVAGKGNGLIPAHMSPSHVDVATLKSMLRKTEEELGVLRLDNSVKQKELLRALDLLQGAHKREGELRCQSQSLSNQLDLARDALQQRDIDIDTLQKEIEELGANSQSISLGDEAQSVRQLEVVQRALAKAKDDAEVARCEAATLASALKSSEEQYNSSQEKLAMLQEYVSRVEEQDERRGNERGSQAAIGLTKTVIFARLAVHGFSLVCQALSSSS